MLFTLARLFGGDLRTSVFFQLPILDRALDENFDFKFAEQPSELVQYGICKLVEKFGQLNGFEQLLSLVNLGPDNYCPLEILSQIPVGTLTCYLKDSFASEFIPKYRDAVLNRVNNVTSKELKGIDKSYYSRILNNLALLMGSMTSSITNYEMVETLELNLALKFIKCGLLEKRLRGIKEISDFIERVHVTSHPPKKTEVQINPVQPTRWLNESRLSSWISENNLVTLLLGEYSHAEVLKRCPDIIKFMASENALTREQLDLILESSSGKHDSIIRVVYQLIVDIIDSLPLEQSNYIFDKLAGIPIAEWDEKLIETLREFTFKANLKKDEILPYAIPLFQEQIKDTSQLSEALAELALESLCELLRAQGYSEIRERICESCYENLRGHVDVSQSLTLIMSIIDHYQLYKIEGHVTRQQIIERSNEKFDLIQTTIDDLTQYMANPPASRYSYSSNIQKRFEFLSYLVHNSDFALTISLDNLSHLWNLFTNSSHEDQQLFFKWLCKKQSHNSLKPYVLDPDLLDTAFTDFICNIEKLPPNQFTKAAFKCFTVFFEYLNTESKNIIGTVRGRFKRMSENIQGIDALWEIALKAEDETVQSRARALLIELQISLSSRLNRQQIWLSFISSTFDRLAYAQDNNLVNALLEVIRLLLDRFEGKGAPPFTPVQFGQYIPVNIIINKTDTNEQR